MSMTERSEEVPVRSGSGPAGPKKGHGSKFGRKKDEAILALLTKRTVEEAAVAIGVAPNTLLKWTKDPEFDAALTLARRGAFRQASAWLQQGVKGAVSTIMRVMSDPKSPAAIRLRAAEAVLSHAEKSIEIEDMDARLIKLEILGRSANPE